MGQDMGVRVVSCPLSPGGHALYQWLPSYRPHQQLWAGWVWGGVGGCRPQSWCPQRARGAPGGEEAGPPPPSHAVPGSLSSLRGTVVTGSDAGLLELFPSGPPAEGVLNCPPTPWCLLQPDAPAVHARLPPSPRPCGWIPRKPGCGSLVGGQLPGNSQVTGPAAVSKGGRPPGRLRPKPRPTLPCPPPASRLPGLSVPIHPFPPVRCHRHPARSSVWTRETREGHITQ